MKREILHVDHLWEFKVKSDGIQTEARSTCGTWIKQWDSKLSHDIEANCQLVQDASQILKLHSIQTEATRIVRVLLTSSAVVGGGSAEWHKTSNSNTVNSLVSENPRELEKCPLVEMSAEKIYSQKWTPQKNRLHVHLQGSQLAGVNYMSYWVSKNSNWNSLLSSMLKLEKKKEEKNEKKYTV